MIGKLLPVILALIGVGGGIGAGLALKPEGSEMTMENPCGDVHHQVAAAEESHAEKEEEKDTKTLEYVKLNNQFMVPIVTDEIIRAMVVMNLSVEVMAGQGEVVYSREPKLRDAFLQVLFDHANIGGFKGEFTNAKNLNTLRNALTEVAQSIAGKNVTGILITDIARQDV